MDRASQRQEDGHAEQASPVFHGRLQGAFASLPLWPVGPSGLSPHPETPYGLKPEEYVTRGPGRQTQAPGTPLPTHSQHRHMPLTSSLSRACVTPAPACRFMLGEDPPPHLPSFLHAARSPPFPVPFPLSCLPVWSGIYLQVKQYLRVLYIQLLL